MYSIIDPDDDDLTTSDDLIDGSEMIYEDCLVWESARDVE